MSDWLEDFVAYTSHGEASPRLMYWVGVSTIAGALRRKVFIQEDGFQWVPNFYILVVGDPGSVRKTTSMDRGIAMLRQLDGINFGPDSVTWQALIEYIAGCKEEVTFEDGEVFEMSCVTLAISEFGTFFDPLNRDLKDNLTSLWDNRIGSVKKMTKTSGNDEMVNAWINLIAGTTPTWVEKNFGEDLVGGGLASRFVFLYEPMPDKDISYPSRRISDREAQAKLSDSLIARLHNISGHAGEARMTEEAYEWGDAWYMEERRKLRAMPGSSLERDFIIRKQGHLHKLAIVISAARNEFPAITVEHLEEADRRMRDLEVDAKKVFGSIGQSKITAATRQIVATVRAEGPVEKRLLYQRQFLRTLTFGEYSEAVQSAIQAELIMEQDGVAKPMLVPR